MSNVMNLPYVCDCGCNYVNGDMFADYFRHLGVEPTEKDNQDFEVARRLYQALREEKEKAEAAEKERRLAKFKIRSKKYTKRSDYWNKRSKTNIESLKKEYER